MLADLYGIERGMSREDIMVIIETYADASSSVTCRNGATPLDAQIDSSIHNLMYPGRPTTWQEWHRKINYVDGNPSNKKQRKHMGKPALATVLDAVQSGAIPLLYTDMGEVNRSIALKAREWNSRSSSEQRAIEVSSRLE